MPYAITMLEGYVTPRAHSKESPTMKLATAAKKCKGKKNFHACVSKQFAGYGKKHRRSRRSRR